MKCLYSCWSFLLLLCMCGWSANSVAHEGDLIVVDVMAGLAETDDQRYDSSSMFDGSMGYLSRGWIYRAGFSGVETFTLKKNGRAEVEVYGAYIQAAKIFEVGWFDLELGGGLYRHTIKSYLVNRVGDHESRKELSRDNPVGPFFSGFLTKDINRTVSVQIGYRYLARVSDVNISLLLAGARISF